MPDEMLYEITQSPAKIAARLRKLADELEKDGKVTVVDQEIDIPERLHMKVELEEEHDGDLDDANFEIEVEFTWPVRMQED